MTERVLIVDDNALLRAGLATVLSSDPGIEVVGEAASGPEGVRRALETRPDVVLMDVEMHEGGGIAATEMLHHELPEARVLILTMFDIDDYVIEALRAGAAGFLLKTTEPDALIRAVHDCADGSMTLAPTVVERIVSSFITRPSSATSSGIADLTERERDVLRSLAGGRSNAEIATHLHLAETTVKTHVAHVLMKLEVRDRVQATVIAHRAGLIDDPLV